MTQQMTTSKRRYARGPNEQSDIAAAAKPQDPAAPRQSKIATVIAMLQRADGATLGEIVQTTGWLPHSARAALTGLKKKGHTIERFKRGDVTCYRIAEPA